MEKKIHNELFFLTRKRQGIPYMKVLILSLSNLDFAFKSMTFSTQTFVLSKVLKITKHAIEYRKTVIFEL